MEEELNLHGLLRSASRVSEFVKVRFESMGVVDG